MLMELLNFAFTGFWIWLGCFLMLLAVTNTFWTVLTGILLIFKR